MHKHLRQHRYSLWSALFLAFVIALQPAVTAFAGTVATITGTVSDDTGAPVAGAAVAAVSPSGTYHARTDSKGYYAFAGVAPDTYTISFQAQGYEPQALTGVVAWADQTVRADVRLVKSLKTIAKVTSRNTAGAFQPSQTADTYSVNAAQMQAIQGNALNVSEKNLIRALPGASYTNGDAPSIRGGRSNNVDYEVEGVPYINPYTNGNVNQYTMPSFAYQSLQVSPGNEDASFGNSGVGTINAVLQRGSYPGHMDVIAGVGAPHFYHGLGLGWGTADPNGRWSNYMSYTADNTAPRYGGNLEGNSTLNGSYGGIQLVEGRDFTNNFVYKFGNDKRFDIQYFTDIGWHRRSAGYGQNQAHYDLNRYNGAPVYAPMCYATCNPAWLSYFTNYDPSVRQQIYGFWGGGACYFGNWDGITVQQFQNMAPFYPGQTQAYQTLTDRPYYQEFDQNSTQKIALDFRPDSRTLATLSYYNTSAQNIGDSISIYPFDSGDVWMSEGGYSHAFLLDVSRQLNEANHLKVGLSVRHDQPRLQSISPMTSWFNPLFNGNMEQFDFINPNSPIAGMNACGVGAKPGLDPATGQPWGIPGMIFFPSVDNINTNDKTAATTPACGWLYQYFPGVKQLQLPAAENGNTIHPSGGAVYFDDIFTPNDRLKVDIGLRVDYQNNHLPTPQVYWDCTTSYLPLTWGVQQTDPTKPGYLDPATGLFNGKPMGPGNCPSATFLPVSSYASHPVVPEPRIALSYLLTKNDAVRFSWGRTVRFPDGVFNDSVEDPAPYAMFAGIPSHMNTTFIQPFWWSLVGAFSPYNITTSNNVYTKANQATTCGMANYGIPVPCQSYQEQMYWTGWNGDFGKPLFPLAPITYSNFDFSWAHRLPGGWEIKATPWSRRAYDLDISQQIANTTLPTYKNADGTTGYHYYGLISNAGIEIARGVELYLTKLTPWHGLSGSLSASFQHVVQNTDPNGSPIGVSGDISGSRNNETTGAQSIASAAFGKMFNVNYVTPFSSSLNLQYEKHGWRLQTQWFYDAGYPYGEGTNALQVRGNKPYILPNTNDCTGGATQYADPTNPGSCFSPNIVATRGTNEGSFANQVYTHPNLIAALTLERNFGSGKLGFTINNLFNEVYTGPTIPNGTDFGQTGPRLSTAYLNDQGAVFGQNGGAPVSGMFLNPTYQPVATGVSGPLTGKGLFGNTFGNAALLCATCAYIHLPNSEGRTYYMYYQFRVGGSH